MNSTITSIILTGFWMMLTLLLTISLADKLPADFMNRNYTGLTIKPHPAAQVAFLTIAGTSIFMFLVWAMTALVSHYYDYLLARLLPLLAVWWFISLVLALILRQLSKETKGFRLAVAIGLVAIVGSGIFAPTIKSFSLGFLSPPIPATVAITEKNASTSKNGTNYAVYVDESVYKVTRSAYSEIRAGETVELVHTEFENMLFPIHHLKLTWFGAGLLGLNLLSIAGALLTIGYGLIELEVT
jgi:hypothetical protein